jgi:hypothetical protein
MFKLHLEKKYNVADAKRIEIGASKYLFCLSVSVVLLKDHISIDNNINAGIEIIKPANIATNKKPTFPITK